MNRISSSLILVIVSLGVASATSFDFETKLGFFEYRRPGSSGTLYLRINPKFKVALNDNANGDYDFKNAAVYKYHHDLDLPIEQMESAYFQWMPSTTKPDSREPIAVEYVKINANGKTVKLCGDKYKLVSYGLTHGVNLKKC